MNISEVKFTQVLSLDSRPFRQNILDYSHVDYASVLDAFAGSILVICLSASLAHLSGLLLGMRTRSVVVGSLYEQYLFPNVFCFFKIFGNTSEDISKRKSYLISQLIAGFFLTILLAVEALVIYSNTPVEQTVRLEDLQIKWPQFSSYDGPLRLKQLPNDCYPFYSTERSISVSPVSFCIHTRSFLIDRRESRTKYRFLFHRSSKYPHMNLFCEHNRTTVRQAILLASQVSKFRIAVKTDMLIKNEIALLAWFAQNIRTTFDCENYSFTDGRVGDDIKEMNFTGCKKSSNDGCDFMVRNVFIGALGFSRSSLRREYFAEFNFNHTTSEVIDPSEATGIDWDAFGSFRRSRVPGYIIWLTSLFAFIINIYFGFYGPDLMFAKQIAASQHLGLDSIPAHLQEHTKI